MKTLLLATAFCLSAGSMTGATAMTINAASPMISKAAISAPQPEPAQRLCCRTKVKFKVKIVVKG